MADNVIDLQINTKTIEQNTEVAVVSIHSLIDALGALSAAADSAFSIGGYKDYLKTVKRFGKALTDELLVLQLSFGKLKATIADACAPIAAVFVPMLNNAIATAIRFADYIGQFFRGIIAGITGHDALADSADQAAVAEDNLASSAKKAGSAVRRSLMGFDQINRLNGGSGGSSGSSSVDFGAYVPGEISPEVQALVDQVLALLAPILAIDLEPLKAALQGLKEALSHLASLAGSAFLWMWEQVLAPFIVWLMEQFAPAVTEFWAAKLELVAAAIEPVMAGMEALWHTLEPVIDYIGDQVLTALSHWQAAFEDLAAVFQEKSPQITGVLQNLAVVMGAVWNAVSPVLTAMGNYFSLVFDNISQTVTTVTAFIIEALYGLTGYVAGVFTGDWASAWEGVKSVLRSVVNGVISILNGMLRGIGSALNSVVSAANRLSFTVPNWVPTIGGKTFSLGLGYVSVPQIPYLAKGAVLPANKPFLAMVGDQRHGTNIEAPLETIQQAVAAVMQENMDSNMAGHNATVQVLQSILQAVLGIHIGDETIARAVSRYDSRMAAMKGV